MKKPPIAKAFPQADRDRDSGVYTIRLTCEAGTFEASGRVNVLDVPLKPRNLNPDEIRYFFIYFQKNK